MKTWIKVVGGLAVACGLATTAGLARAGYAAEAWGPAGYPAWGTPFSGTITDTNPTRSVTYSMWSGNFFGAWIAEVNISANTGAFTTTTGICCSDGSCPTQQRANATNPSAGNSLVSCPAGTSGVEGEAFVTN